MKYKIGLEGIDHEKWDDFIAKNPRGNYRQTYAWAKIRKNAGWEPIFVHAEEKGNIRASILILARKIPYIGLSIFYGCRGPTVDWDDTESIEVLIQGVIEAARRHKAIVLRVDPEPAETDMLRKRLKDVGFLLFDKEFTTWNRTQYELRIHLEKDEDEIFNRTLRRSLRQNINLCYKRGVSIEEGLLNGDSERFCEIMSRHEITKKAVSHFNSYYTIFLNQIIASGGVFLKAKYEGNTIATMALALVGNRCWALYLANDYEYRKLEPNKLLLWEGIKYAKKHACIFFDIGATQGMSYDPDYPLDKFKLGFRPEVVRFPGFFDYPFSKPFYGILRFSESWLIPLVMKVSSAYNRLRSVSA